MQKTPPMHLNTSPTSFEGSGTGKRETKHKTLKNLKLAPKLHLSSSLFLPLFKPVHHCIIAFTSGRLHKAGSGHGGQVIAGQNLQCLAVGKSKCERQRRPTQRIPTTYPSVTLTGSLRTLAQTLDLGSLV